MAAGAIARCLKQYGEATLITALQCVSQTSNNHPCALSARAIKALCAVLHGDLERRDSGLALFDAFDSIDLIAVQDASAVDAAVKKVGRVQAMADRILAELNRVFPQRTETKKFARRRVPATTRMSSNSPIGQAGSTKVARQPR
jgi:hypothetical protein